MADAARGTRFMIAGPVMVAAGFAGIIFLAELVANMPKLIFILGPALMLLGVIVFVTGGLELFFALSDKREAKREGG
jgi:hypothetical protein